MNPVTPNRDNFLLPANTRQVTYAKDQPEYLPLPVLRTPDGRVISQWRPTAEELELLKRGWPVTLILHTFNSPLQPTQVVVGGMDLR